MMESIFKQDFDCIKVIFDEKNKIKYDIYKNNIIEEESKMKINKIIDIYESRVKNKIYKKFKETEKEILREDIFQNLSSQFYIQAKEIYKNEFDKELPYKFSVLENIYSKDTEEKLTALKEGTELKLKELSELIEELEAQLDLVPEDDYETTIKILKRYDILNKDGKINA